MSWDRRNVMKHGRIDLKIGVRGTWPPLPNFYMMGPKKKEKEKEKKENKNQKPTIAARS